MKTPVAFLIFNRPDTTEKVFETIHQAKPPKLLVVADGPRPDKTGEAEKCQATREIIKRVDWDCEVLTDYSDVNLGCQNRVYSGLDWVFENVEEAIILEDDCLPHPTFFRFCEELLEYYRHDNRVGVISGQNVQFGIKRTNYSYYFSKFNHCWGWASWKRAWNFFDFDMKLWPDARDRKMLQNITHNKTAYRYWTNIFQKTYDGKINSWALRWTFACWMQNFLTVLPNVNLISNIGFGDQSTHTPDPQNRFANLSIYPMKFPLEHPSVFLHDFKADNFTQKELYEKLSRPTFRRIYTKLNYLVKK